MTNQTTPAQAGGEAQPIADANPIDSIIDNAVIESNEATKEMPGAEATDTKDAAAETEEAWPKKAENALAKAKGRAAQLKAERDNERAARQRLEQQLAQYSQSQNPQQKPVNTGEPKEGDFTSYADYMRAVQKYDLEQGFAKYEGKQQETQKTQQEQAYYEGLYKQTQAKSDEFISQVPDAQSVFDEHAETIEACPDNIYKLFLESGDAPLAAYNLAKQGRLEEIIAMSPAKAAIEIGRALAQAPAKPKTKAPTPLPATRGSVPSGKSLDQMSGPELLKWVNSKG